MSDNPKYDTTAQTQPTWWLDSNVMKGLLVAVGPAVGLIASVLFGITEAVFDAMWAKIVEAVMALVLIGALIYAAHQRATKPTPPLTLSKPKETTDATPAP